MLDSCPEPHERIVTKLGLKGEGREDELNHEAPKHGMPIDLLKIRYRKSVEKCKEVEENKGGCFARFQPS